MGKRDWLVVGVSVVLTLVLVVLLSIGLGKSPKALVMERYPDFGRDLGPLGGESDFSKAKWQIAKFMDFFFYDPPGSEIELVCVTTKSSYIEWVKEQGKKLPKEFDKTVCIQLPSEEDIKNATPSIEGYDPTRQIRDGDTGEVHL